MFGWFKKKPVAQPEVIPLQPPRLTFEIHDKGDLTIACSWPTPANDEELTELIRGYATLLFLLHTGKLLTHTQHALMQYNPQDKLCAGTAKNILLFLQKLFENEGMFVPTKNTSDPIVQPKDAFRVRGGPPND